MQRHILGVLDPTAQCFIHRLFVSVYQCYDGCWIEYRMLLRLASPARACKVTRNRSTFLL